MKFFSFFSFVLLFLSYSPHALSCELFDPFDGYHLIQKYRNLQNLVGALPNELGRLAKITVYENRVARIRLVHVDPNREMYDSPEKLEAALAKFEKEFKRFSVPVLVQTKAQLRDWALGATKLVLSWVTIVYSLLALSRPLVDHGYYSGEAFVLRLPSIIVSTATSIGMIAAAMNIPFVVHSAFMELRDNMKSTSPFLNAVKMRSDLNAFIENAMSVTYLSWQTGIIVGSFDYDGGVRWLGSPTNAKRLLERRGFKRVAPYESD